MKQLTILSAILLGATGNAVAQELNSEFTVTHQVVPEERAATRLQLLPQLQLPAVDAGRLPSSGLVTAGPVSPTLTFMQPVPWASTLAVSPWRGYAQLAYGPAYNLDASAGYRIIDRSNLQLGAFMQFNGFKYSSSAHPDTPWRVYGKPTLRRNTFAAGSSLTWRPIKDGTLRVAADYTFSAHNIPMPVVKIEDGMVLPDADNPATSIYNINHNGLNISADWAHNVSAKFRYTLSASYGLTAFSRYAEGCTENRGTLGTSLIYDYGKKSHWQLDLSMLSVEMSDFGHKGVLSVAPLYRLTLRRFMAQLGFKADFLLGNVHNFDDNNGTDGWLYPRLDLCWKPSAMFTLWGKIDGRTDANTMASLFEAQPYNFPVNFMPVTYHYIDVENETIGTTIINEPLGYSA
ncbi:MAG: hypothetical protein K2M97_03760, partial [Muribaculaceae bacterium]|nr:hypothetical protein [Muribaculaceae bacterium]